MPVLAVSILGNNPVVAVSALPTFNFAVNNPVVAVSPVLNNPVPAVSPVLNNPVAAVSPVLNNPVVAVSPALNNPVPAVSPLLNTPEVAVSIPFTLNPEVNTPELASTPLLKIPLPAVLIVKEPAPSLYAKAIPVPAINRFPTRSSTASAKLLITLASWVCPLAKTAKETLLIVLLVFSIKTFKILPGSVVVGSAEEIAPGGP